MIGRTLRTFLAAAAVLGMAGSAVAQMSIEEAQARLAKRITRRDPRATTAPAPVPTTQQAVAPATAPAPFDPSNLTIDQLHERLIACQQREREAMDNAVAGFHLTPKYQTAASQLSKAAAALDKARASGTPNQKIQASHDFVAAKQLVQKLDEGAIASSPEVAACRETVAEISGAYYDAENAERTKEAPLLDGIAKGRIVLGMTESQAMQAFKNRKERNNVEGVDFGRSQENVIKTSRDELGDGVQRLVLMRYRHFMNGQETLVDEITITLTNGKVTQVFSQ